MSIAPNAPLGATTPTSGDVLRQLRADTHALTVRTDALGEEYGSVQTLSNNGYNSAHDAYENANAATNPSIPSPASGPAISVDVSTLSASQPQLNTVCTTAVTDLEYCRGEVLRISTAVTNLAASMAPGPVATALQTAVANFSAGLNQQNNISFDASASLQDITQTLGTLSEEAAVISADTGAGVDASATADQAQIDAQTLQNDYGEISNIAYPAGYSELSASGYLHQAGAAMDQAITALPPDPSATPAPSGT